MKKFICVIILGHFFILQSCGDSNNKVSGEKDIPYSAIQIGSIEKIKKANPCLYNATRLKQSISFSSMNFNLDSMIVSRDVEHSTIDTDFNPSIIQDGPVERIYVGKDLHKNLIFISKIINGTQTKGYNITLSLCPVTQKNTLVISRVRMPSDNKMTLTSGLDDNIQISTSSCGDVHSVSKAYLTVYVPQHQGDEYYSASVDLRFSSGIYCPL